MRIKTGLFFFLSFCCIITPIAGIIDRYCITENIKNNRGKWEQIKNKYTLKIMNILRTASIGSHFTASYKKRVYSFVAEVTILSSTDLFCKSRFTNGCNFLSLIEFPVMKLVNSIFLFAKKKHALGIIWISRVTITHYCW